MSIKHKISGFFTALILAVVSFLAIYFFLPYYSEKYLGTSYQSDREVKKTISEVKKEIADSDASSFFDNLFKK